MLVLEKLFLTRLYINQSSVSNFSNHFASFSTYPDPIGTVILWLTSFDWKLVSAVVRAYLKVVGIFFRISRITTTLRFSRLPCSRASWARDAADRQISKRRSNGSLNAPWSLSAGWKIIGIEGAPTSNLWPVSPRSMLTHNSNVGHCCVTMTSLPANKFGWQIE